MRRALLIALLAVAAAAGLFVVPVAAAGVGPELLTKIPGDDIASGPAAGQFYNPRGIAVDSNTGHFYVADTQNRRIDEFTPWGVFVKGWGWGVDTGAAELQT